MVDKSSVEMTPITNSSNIAGIGHDGADLYVKFTNGSTYRYPAAPDHHVKEMQGAESAGRYFIQNIKDAHQGVKV